SHSATFSKDAHFYSATFSGNASFFCAKFRGNAEFDSATFSGNAYFNGSDFFVTANFRHTLFLAATPRENARVRFEVCSFRKKTDFTNALFQQTALFNSSVINDELCFNNVRFSDNLDLSGICLLGNGNGVQGALSFVGMKGQDVFFGVSQPFIGNSVMYRGTPAGDRAINAHGQPLSDDLDTGCSVELTGAH